MKPDTFFTQTKCDRCGKDLYIRTMSWFTNETICMDCSRIEDSIKAKLNDARQYEGCGYIPKI
jgi:hypothetical protein